MPKDLGGTRPDTSERQFHTLWNFLLRKIDVLDPWDYDYYDVVLLFSDTDADISYGWDIWHGGYIVDRTEARVGMDLQVDTLSVIMRNTDLTIYGVTRPVGHWVKVRRFHGAKVEVYILDYRNAVLELDSVWFVQSARVSITSVEFVLESLLSKMRMTIPKNVFQRECNNMLYDNDLCRVRKHIFEVKSTVVAATSDSVTYGALAPSRPPVLPNYVDGYFDLGHVVFRGGNLSGLQQTIGRHTGSTVFFISPLPEVPDVGSAISIWPGCHKNIEDCRNKFGNFRWHGTWRGAFRGFPYMPAMEELIG